MAKPGIVGLALVMGAVIALAGCGGSRGPNDPTLNRIQAQKLKAGPALRYEAAMHLKVAGEYDRAIVILRPLAEVGQGYEIAQFHLAESLLAQADKTTDTAKADAMRREAHTWFDLAARSNQIDSQARLAELHFNGSIEKADKIEAAKWFLLTARNPNRRLIGDARFRDDLPDKLNVALNAEQWLEARVRADAFVPEVQPLNTEALKKLQKRAREDKKKERRPFPSDSRTRRPRI